MVRLILLLLGHDFIRRRWLMLALVGLVWGALGAAIFVDALDGVTYFPIHVFGYLLLVEAVVTLAVTPAGADTRVVLRKARGIAFLVLGLLVVDAHHAASVILAMLFGLAFLADGIFRMAAAVVVRFVGWRLSLLTGLLEVAFAVFMFEPYPTFYAGTVPYCIGMGIFLSGCGLLRQAFRLKRLPGHGSAFLWLSRHPVANDKLVADALVAEAREEMAKQDGDLIVRVWTPAESAADAVVPRPLIDRYIAAVDSRGVISTGHAALEASPGIYISHYPSVEIDRSEANFARVLRATADNDVPGAFKPSYAAEAAGWCEATAEVRFERYDRPRLAAFWCRYRAIDTYNLTSRNCSSTVANALEAALEGSLAGTGLGLGALFRAMFNPELWVAAQLQRRAQAMAWTPGLVLDYARTLRAAITPTPLGWSTLFAQGARFWRYAGIVWRREPMQRIETIRDELNHAKSKDAGQH
jgi:uncharacterized membrane protein HdeD (DUF308 family)